MPQLPPSLLVFLLFEESLLRCSMPPFLIDKSFQSPSKTEQNKERTERHFVVFQIPTPSLTITKTNYKTKCLFICPTPIFYFILHARKAKTSCLGYFKTHLQLHVLSRLHLSTCLSTHLHYSQPLTPSSQDGQ